MVKDTGYLSLKQRPIGVAAPGKVSQSFPEDIFLFISEGRKGRFNK